MTTKEAERREANRLRSERWRRAHGIMPRRPAARPWLAEGVSRSTWYRRGNRIGQALRKSPQIVRIIPYPDLSRASAFVAQLQCELAEVARCNAIAAAIIGEIAAETFTT
jgi:hypothetical protein